jgi:hypothetical protein
MFHFYLQDKDEIEAESDDPEVLFLKSLTPQQKKKLLKYTPLLCCINKLESEEFL